jgi:hypothetical protein
MTERLNVSSASMSGKAEMLCLRGLWRRRFCPLVTGEPALPECCYPVT